MPDRIGKGEQEDEVAQNAPDIPALRVALLALAHCLIDLFSARHFIRCDFSAYRLIAHNLAILHDRHNEGADPIETTILAAILDDAHEAFTTLDGIPQDLEHLGRHIWMAQNIVRLSDQLLAGVTTHVNKGLVDIGDNAASISYRDDLSGRIIREMMLNIGHRLIVAHMVSIQSDLLKLAWHVTRGPTSLSRSKSKTT